MSGRKAFETRELSRLGEKIERRGSSRSRRMTPRVNKTAPFRPWRQLPSCVPQRLCLLSHTRVCIVLLLCFRLTGPADELELWAAFASGLPCPVPASSSRGPLVPA